MYRTVAAIATVALFAGLSGAGAQSRNIEVVPKPGAPVISAYRDSWAVIVGINDYQHPKIPKLRAAINDARAVERALIQQGFHRDRIIMLLDRQATKSAIERVLGDQLRTQMGRDDRLLVFFAGHGKTVRLDNGEDEGYLLPVDADPSQPYSTSISMDAVGRISRRLPAKHVLYVVDACYSGYAIFKPRAISDDLLQEMVRKPAIQILTAGRQGDEAQERGDRGVFTDVFVRGIDGGAFSSVKNWLATDELYTWVRDRVYAESAKLQLPQFGNLHGEGQFVFVRAGAKVAVVPPPTAAPPKTGWYLLLPPTNNENENPDTRRPLAEWAMSRAFDMASDCEDYRRKELTSYRTTIAEERQKRARAKQQVPASKEEAIRSILFDLAQKEFHQFVASICISATDPRLVGHADGR